MNRAAATRGRRIGLRIVCLLFAVAFIALTGVSASADTMTAASLKKKMDEICSEYGFESGKYWSYQKVEGDSTQTNINKKSYKASTKKANTSSSDDLDRPGATGWYGYTFDSGSECWAFASFIGYKLFGQSNPQNGGWTKYTSAEAVRKHGVCVGDIIRTTGSGKFHSAIVYSISSNGTIRFIECWGTRNNIIKVNNTFAGSVGNIEDLLNNEYGNFSFLAHASNNTSTPGWKPKAMELTVSGYTGVYDGKAHGISVTVTKPASNATVKYGTKSGTYDKSKSPTYTNAGTYTVYYQAYAPGYYATTAKYKKTGSAKVVIEKADSAVETPPAGRDLFYTGRQMPLVTTGAVTGGTLQYSLDGQTYSDTIPQALGPGSYTIWYYVKGDANHKDTEPQSVRTDILQPPCWQKRDGKWYYYDANGAKATGWLADGGKWYYLDPADGHMTNGWQKVDGKWYYLNPGDNGYMVTGWQKIGTKWYYLLPGEGYMANGWQKVDGKWYYLNPGDDGYMVTGWKAIGGKWYYLKPGAGYMTNGWQLIDGKWYYLNPGDNGFMVTGWKKLGSKWYYLKPGDGWMVNGWTKLGSKWYYLNPGDDGFMVTGWKKLGSKWYYLNPGDDGFMVTGWKKLGSKWYYLNPGDDGFMVTGWKAIGGKWYYLNPGDDGFMVNGWRQVDGCWYYLNLGDDGYMLTGTHTIDGKSYTFNENGVCLNP